MGCRGPAVGMAEGSNSWTHSAHLEDDGNVASQPVTRDLLLTSQTLLFFRAESIFTLAVIFGSLLTFSFRCIFFCSESFSAVKCN